MRRLAALLVTIAAVVVVLSPLVWDEDRDSYPISTYPMFARDRGRVRSYATVVGVRAGGEIERLSPEAIAGTREPVQAAETVIREVRRGHAAALCDDVAARVAGRDGDAEPRSLEVVTETYDVLAYFDGRTEPEQRVVHATCDVAR
jgi:hypothetical protein